MNMITLDNEIHERIEDVIKQRLVEGREGCLKVEFHPEERELCTTQYPSSNNWQEGHITLYQIDDYEDWSDFLEGVRHSDGEIRFRIEDWKNHEVLRYNAVIDEEEQEYVIRSDSQLIEQIVDETDWEQVIPEVFYDAKRLMYEHLEEEVEDQ